MADQEWQTKAREVTELIAGAERVVALTGSGISVESGIPSFRGAQGLWQKYDPMDYANIDSFRSDPVRVWAMLQEMDELIMAARPNPAHTALAELESLERCLAVVTQNVDGLHQSAGSSRVIEFHGSGRSFVCLDCGRGMHRREVPFSQMPPRCVCGGLVKPAVVFFGEPIPQRALMTAMALAQEAEVMLVVGTSAVVAPASHLPVLTRQGGGKVVEINLEPSHLTNQISDVYIEAGASEVLPYIVARLRERLGGGD